MKKITRFFVLLTSLAICGAADCEIRGVEHMGSSARMIALGGIGVIGTEGIEPVFQNPALLSSHEEYGLGIMTAQPYGDTSYQTIGFTLPPYNGILTGLGIQKAGVGGIYHTVMDPNTQAASIVDTFFFEQGTIKVAVGKEIFSSFNAGIDLGYTFMNAEDHASGSGFTLGIGGLIRMSDWMALGGQISNLLQAYHWSNGKSENLARSFLFGAGFHPFSSTSLLVSLEKEQGKDFVFRTGAAYKPFPSLELRGGLFQYRRSANRNDTGLTVGMGVELNSFYLDYAYRYNSEYAGNSTHYFSLRYAFAREELTPSPGQAASEPAIEENAVTESPAAPSDVDGPGFHKEAIVQEDYPE